MSPATAEIVKEPELEAAELARAALVKVPSPSLMPVFRGQQMTEAFLAYRELQKALDAGMPDQLMNIRGKVFRKKGYWRAIATAFNLNVSCVKEEAVETGWLVVYRAATPSGRFIDGDGACEHDEKGEGQDSEHNVRSHAHTRAFNRAVSNLVGFGEVSAEEIHAERRPSFKTPTPDTAPVPEPAAVRDLPPGAVLVTKVDETTMASGKMAGKPKWFVHFSDGNKASTIAAKAARFARQCQTDRTPVRVELKKTQWGYDLIELEAMDADDEPGTYEPPPITDDDVPF